MSQTTNKIEPMPLNLFEVISEICKWLVAVLRLMQAEDYSMKIGEYYISVVKYTMEGDKSCL